MEIVEYPRSLQWVGDMSCPRCHKLTPAWRSSGMSECFPHFYCDRCSNVIHRMADQELVWEQSTKELLDQIAATLPNCPSASHPVAAGSPDGMPHGDLTITEAKVVKWIKQPGETVRLLDPVVEMEIDKAVTEIESPAAGVLDDILAPEGTVVALGQQLATIRPA